MSETMLFRDPKALPGFNALSRGTRAGTAVDEFVAPIGFASQVAGDLLRRAREYSSMHHGTWPDWVESRAALISELAVTISGRGDRDPLIAGLAAYDGGRWEPGARVAHLLDSILKVPERGSPGLAAEDSDRMERTAATLPNANTLLHRLIAANVGDVVEHARRIRDRAAAELAAVEPDTRIQALEERASKAERDAAAAVADSKAAKASTEALMRQNGLLRSELRMVAELSGSPDPDGYVEAVALGAGTSNPNGAQPAQEHTELDDSGLVSAAAPEEADGPLPKGIRERGQGRFEALVYRSEAHDGRQRSAGTYGTVEAAVAAREFALSREAAAKEEAETAADSTAADLEPEPDPQTPSAVSVPGIADLHADEEYE